MNQLQQFNEMKKQAKSLGIEVKGLKMAQLKELIEKATTPAPVQETQPTTEATGKTRGRKVDPNSERQKRLARFEQLKQEGLLKRGRPVEENSARQLRLAHRQALIASGVEIKRGRKPKAKLDVVVEAPAQTTPAIEVTVG
jgi:hypothetical protein